MSKTVFNLLKTLSVFVVIAIVIAALSQWWKLYVEGQYYVHGGVFQTLLGVIVPAVVVVVAFYVIRWIVKLRQ